MDIFVFLTLFSVIYLVTVFLFLYRKDKRRQKIHQDHEVIIAKRKELLETDEEEYRIFKEYTDKRMSDDYKDL